MPPPFPSPPPPSPPPSPPGDARVYVNSSILLGGYSLASFGYAQAVLVCDALLAVVPSADGCVVTDVADGRGKSARRHLVDVSVDVSYQLATEWANASRVLAVVRNASGTLANASAFDAPFATPAGDFTLLSYPLPPRFSPPAPASSTRSLMAVYILVVVAVCTFAVVACVLLGVIRSERLPRTDVPRGTRNRASRRSA